MASRFEIMCVDLFREIKVVISGMDLSSKSSENVFERAGNLNGILRAVTKIWRTVNFYTNAELQLTRTYLTKEQRDLISKIADICEEHADENGFNAPAFIAEVLRYISMYCVNVNFNVTVVNPSDVSGTESSVPGHDAVEEVRCLFRLDSILRLLS